MIHVNSGTSHNRAFITDDIGGIKHIWQDPGVPFFIDEDIIVRRDTDNEKPGHLVIEEGCDIIFNEDYGLEVLHENPILDRKSTRLNSSHVAISYAVFCLKKKNTIRQY